MLLDLVEQLVERCLQFGRQRQEKLRPSFADSVEPVYQLCQQVHAQYLANFKEYRAKLNETDDFAGNVEELCARLAQDNRFSAGQEANVIAFMEISRQQLTSYVREDLLIGFITDIRSYLSRAFTEVFGTHYTGGTLRVMSPVFRNTLVGQLRKLVAETALSNDRKQAAAVKLLDGIAAELQSGFAVITKRYQLLRSAMNG